MALENNLAPCFYQASDPAVKEAILTALDGVIKNAGKSLSSAVISRLHTQIKDMLYSEDDQIRTPAAGILGFLLQVKSYLLLNVTL